LGSGLELQHLQVPLAAEDELATKNAAIQDLTHT
jgi:hypothetical protein